jgi:hypothetical protein
MGARPSVPRTKVNLVRSQKEKAWTMVQAFSRIQEWNPTRRFIAFSFWRLSSPSFSP